jgi:hypothetical protein
LAVLAVIGALVLGWQIAAFAGTIGTNSGFQDDDGNLAPSNSQLDWNSFAPPNWTGQSATGPLANYRITNVTDTGGWDFFGMLDEFKDQSNRNADSIYSGGTKQSDNCPTLRTSSAPNKDDIKRVYLSAKTLQGGTLDGHVILNLAWVRIPLNTPQSDAHLSFEFNQSATPCPGTGHTDPAGRSLVPRTGDGPSGPMTDDLLILYDFQGGTDQPVIRISRWTGTGWTDAVALTTGQAEARVNHDQFPLSDLLSPDTTTAGRAVGQKEFGEAGIDLTAAGVFTAGDCVSFGKVSASSRSAGSSNSSNMFDIAGPGDFTLQNCGSIKIIKQTNPRGLNQNFEFTSDIAGTDLSCTSDTTPADFTLNDNGNTGKTQGSTDPAQNSTGNTETCTGVPTGTYTVTEGTQSGFTLSDISCTPAASATTSTTDRNAIITIAAGSNVTCVFTNSQNKQSVLNTEQGFIPQDTATITGTGLVFDGTVDFKLHKGTLGEGETCATTTDPVVYSQDNVALTGTPKTASTNNDGTPSADGATDGYTIKTADAGSFYWEVFYNGSADPDVTSCNEVSTVSINNGTEVKNPPSIN